MGCRLIATKYGLQTRRRRNRQACRIFMAHFENSILVKTKEKFYSFRLGTVPIARMQRRFSAAVWHFVVFANDNECRSDVARLAYLFFHTRIAKIFDAENYESKITLRNR